MRFHVLSVCYTASTKEYLSCAFTQKVIKFCTMMKCKEEQQEIKKNMTTEELIKHPTIHYIMHYGHDKSDVEADEMIGVINDEILKETYGDHDWKTNFFNFSLSDKSQKEFTKNSITEIGKRVQNGDFLLCFWGIGHKEIADNFADKCLIVEPGVGYMNASVFAPFRVFESYAKMHSFYGYQQLNYPKWYDCVIPNYFEMEDFDIQDNTITKRDYYLCLGRIISDKGVDIAIELAIEYKFNLVIAGQGTLEKMGYTNLPDNIKFVGYADLEKRKQLINGAIALFLPSKYIEPFGGAGVEAQICGTPVISTDWGVFNETVLHGKTGFRCRTMDHFRYAVKNVDKLDRSLIKQWARENYNLARIRTMYEEYFDMLIKLKFGNGFYEKNEDRTNLDWLNIKYV